MSMLCLPPDNGQGLILILQSNSVTCVCFTLVVSPDTEIWFLDRALYWHFLTKTFTAYYRLLITHLGLPQWQYAFTSYGVSPQAKVGQLISISHKYRLEKHLPTF